MGGQDHKPIRNVFYRIYRMAKTANAIRVAFR